MCRMIIALGKVKMNSLINGLALMAKDQNSVHELNQRLGKGSFTHGDGWGIAYLKDGKWIIKKSIKPIYQDPKINQLRKMKTNLAILHARQKSVGNKSIRNCHPFHFNDKNVGELVFCHNGWIRNKVRYSSSFKPQGETDSEKLLYSILSKIKKNGLVEATKNSLQNCKCKGTNTIFADKEKSIIALRETILPKYFTMRMAKNKDSLIFSSEELSNLNKRRWQTMKQGKVYLVNNKTLNISIR